jgi:hypothetical protein
LAEVGSLPERHSDEAEEHCVPAAHHSATESGLAEMGLPPKKEEKLRDKGQ